MSEVSYVKCDGCGIHDTDSREESWRRMRVERWAEIHRYDDDEGSMKIYDLCPACFEKMMKEVE